MNIFFYNTLCNVLKFDQISESAVFERGFANVARKRNIRQMNETLKNPKRSNNYLS